VQSLRETLDYCDFCLNEGYPAMCAEGELEKSGINKLWSS